MSFICGTVVMAAIFFTESNARLVPRCRLATPLAIEQLGYSDDEAVRSVGIVFSIGCALTAVSYAVSSPLARRFRLLFLLWLPSCSCSCS